MNLPPLPGGDLAVFPFTGWHLYIQYDKRYAALEDAWVVLQSYLNIVEIALQLVCVMLHVAGKRELALKLAIAVSAATFYKTAIYLALEAMDKYPFTKHLSSKDFWLMVVLPSAFWLALPLYVVKSSFARLTGVQQKESVAPAAKAKKLN